MHPSLRGPFGATLLVLLAACGGSSSSSTPGTQTGGSTALRVTTPQTGGGEGDALASSLLLSAGMPVPLDGRAQITMGDQRLADEIAFRALSHLQVLTYGTNAGASTLGGERVRRLAKEPNAPKDQNDNGTNLDEVWAAELTMLCEAAGAPLPQPNHPIVFPWATGSAELAGSVAGKTRQQLAAWQTVASGSTDIELRQLAEGLLARTLAAVRLLAESRGSQLGPTPEQGRLGAMLLEQAIAIEETVVASLFFDGAVLGRLNTPAAYEPGQGLRWVPSTVSVTLDEKLPGVPASYTPIDPSASLETLAALLEAEAQLAWIGGVENPYPGLRDLLNGIPFGQLQEPRKPRPTEPFAARMSAAEITWETDVRPVLLGLHYCLTCHNGPLPQYGNFDMRTYESVMRGGNHQATNPIVVVGNARGSLLWQSLASALPLLNNIRMPQNGPYLSAGELSIVEDWINTGAKKSPSTPVPPPRIGLDLATALRKNLEAMHYDATLGVMLDRHDGDAPVLYAAASSTGRALQALALYLHAQPTDTGAREMLVHACGFVLDTLTDAEGNAIAGYDLERLEPTGPADLQGHARLAAGLLAAGRVLLDDDVLARGRKLGSVMLSPAWWDATLGLFRTSQERSGRRYTPTSLAAVLAALRELAQDGAVTGARDAHDKLLATLRPFLAYSEWDGLGEVLGDDNPDTDGNGVPEPAAAGGENGRAPLLFGEILEGKHPAEEPVPSPITWSRDIAPLFRSVCVECHLGGAVRGNFRLDTPQLARTPGDSGGVWPLIVPGDPEGSLLYRMLVDRNPVYGHQMPLQKVPLDDRGKQLVRRWILEGATGR
jgi:hypothetical protein